MSKLTTRLSIALLAFALPFATPAFAADSGYAFSVENDSAAAMTVYANGKSECDLAPSKTCRITVHDPDTRFAYAAAGGAQVAFMPGNLEMVDVCKIDTSGAKCADPTGASTN